MLNLIQEAKDFVFQYVRPLQLMEITIGIVFFIDWCAFVILVADWIENGYWVILGFAIPFVLLIGVVQYRSRLAYLLVHSLFLFLIIDGFGGVVNWWPMYLIEMSGEELPCSSCCPSCEIGWYLQRSGISFIAIAFLHNKRMRNKYNWNANLSVKSLLLVIGILWIITIVG